MIIPYVIRCLPDSKLLIDLSLIFFLLLLLRSTIFPATSLENLLAAIDSSVDEDPGAGVRVALDPLLPQHPNFPPQVKLVNAVLDLFLIFLGTLKMTVASDQEHCVSILRSNKKERKKEDGSYV